jgi:hypothetical protein
MLLGQLVEDVIYGLGSTQHSEYNVLANSISPSDQNLVFTRDLGGIVSNVEITIGFETIIIGSVDQSSKTATVLSRGWRGSTASSHAAGSIVTVRPFVHPHRIITEANNEISALSSEGLFQVIPIDLSYDSTTRGYDIDTGGLSVVGIWRVKYKQLGVNSDWQNVEEWSFSPSMPSTDFPSGNALFLDDVIPTAVDVRAFVKTEFLPIDLTSYTIATDLLDTGVPASAHDIISLGTVMRTMATREIARNRTDAQVDPRRLREDVPAGAVASSTRNVVALREQRILEERRKLNRLYPPRRKRHSL